VVTASYYGAALGDPQRFRNAGAAYRYSGLAPTSYESAGRRASGVHISKIGSIELRQAMLVMGTGLALHHPDFAAYKQRLRAAGKKPLVAAIAVAHRAHRLAFALIRVPKALQCNTMGRICHEEPSDGPVHHGRLHGDQYDVTGPTDNLTAGRGKISFRRRSGRSRWQGSEQRR
jgi:hypothetical protein